MTSVVKPSKERNHPVDLHRLLGRVREWKPRTIVDVGDEGGGRVFLWTRVAAEDARIIVAGAPGQPPPALKTSFFNGLAKNRQTVRCVTKAETQKDIHQRVNELLARRWIDILFIDGCRPYDEVRKDFEFYAPLVRKGGLIGWDGVGGTEPQTTDRAGGYQMWQRLKPNVERHAEYLSGVKLPRRGISLIVRQ